MLKVYDDGYQEAQTVQQTRRAVEQDRFAMLGGLGTENNQAIRAYMNQRKVPQLYVSTGLSEFGRLYRQNRWTIGWQPDYVQEGILLGRYVRQNRRTRGSRCCGRTTTTAVNSPNPFERRRRRTRGRHGDLPAERRRRHPGPGLAPPRIGWDTFLIVATPTETITALVVAYRLGWRPNKLVNSVGATDTYMTAARNSAGSPVAVDGVDDGVPQGPLVADVRQRRPGEALPAPDGEVRAGPARERRPVLLRHGGADTFIQALYRAGRNPTRQSVMNAVANLKWKSPWLLPGSTISTSPGSAFPIRYQKLSRYQNNAFIEFGNLVKTR